MKSQKTGKVVNSGIMELKTLRTEPFENTEILQAGFYRFFFIRWAYRFAYLAITLCFMFLWFMIIGGKTSLDLILGKRLSDTYQYSVLFASAERNNFSWDIFYFLFIFLVLVGSFIVYFAEREISGIYSSDNLLKYAICLSMITMCCMLSQGLGNFHYFFYCTVGVIKIEQFCGSWHFNWRTGITGMAGAILLGLMIALPVTLFYLCFIFYSREKQQYRQSSATSEINV